MRALGAGGMLGELAPDASHHESLPLDLSLRDQVAGIEAGTFTGSDLASRYLVRIAERDPT